MKFHHFFAFLALILMAACGDAPSDAGNDSSATPTEGSAEEAPKPQVLPYEDDAIYLDRMYATNTGSQGVANVLDNNTDSYWETPQGASVNEGVMLYFADPQEVDQIEILIPASHQTSQQYKIYADGAEKGITGPNEPLKLAASGPIQSIFVRVMDEDGRSEEFEDHNEGLYRTLTSFSENTQALIGEIRLMDANGEALKVRPLTLVPGTIQPSSVLSPPEAYNGDFLFDSRLEFGWAEGKDDLGVGETIEFNFERTVRVEEIKVWNGYQRSDRHFSSNARVKKLSFGAEGKMQTFDLSDQQAPEALKLEAPIEGQKFVLEIVEAYPGAKYEDLLLSELRFSDGQQWFGIASKGEADRKSALENELAGTVLETNKLLDRSFSMRSDPMGGDSYTTTSLLLRSNGSFVLYHEEVLQQGDDRISTEQIADGNWSIESKNGTNVRIKVFGNLRQVFGKTDIYTKKSSSRNSSRIYSEIINIDGEKFSGSNLAENLYYRVPADAAN